MVNMNMGDKLKSLRLEKKLTQKQIADRIGLAISAVSSYESGTRYPSYDVLVKLARIFHVSTDYLLGMTDTREIDVTGLSDAEIALISQLVETFISPSFNSCFTPMTIHTSAFRQISSGIFVSRLCPRHSFPSQLSFPDTNIIHLFNPS